MCSITTASSSPRACWAMATSEGGSGRPGCLHTQLLWAKQSWFLPDKQKQSTFARAHPCEGTAAASSSSPTPSKQFCIQTYFSQLLCVLTSPSILSNAHRVFGDRLCWVTDGTENAPLSTQMAGKNHSFPIRPENVLRDLLMQRLPTSFGLVYSNFKMTFHFLQ